MTRRPKSGPFWIATSGSGAVEFALIAPVLILLLLGATDFSLWIGSRMQVAAAARAGAAYAVAHGYDATNITTAITSATSLQGVSANPAPSQSCGCPDPVNGVVAASCGSTCPTGAAAGSYVTATATTSYSTIVTWPGVSRPMTITSIAKVRLN